MILLEIVSGAATRWRRGVLPEVPCERLVVLLATRYELRAPGTGSAASAWG